MKKKNNNVWIFVLIAMMFIIMSCTIYTVWSVATSRVSGGIDCSFSNIDYITYQNSATTRGYDESLVTYSAPECIPFVSGIDFTVCALPQDIHCSGTLQNFPIVRAIVEAMR